MTDEVKHWVELGREHLDGAKILLDKGYPTDVIGLLLHQSLRSYFKGILAHWDIDPQEDEDIRALFDSVIQKEKRFKKFEDLCTQVHSYYVFGELSPDPLSEKVQEEMKNAISDIEKLIGETEKEIL